MNVLHECRVVPIVPSSRASAVATAVVRGTRGPAEYLRMTKSPTPARSRTYSHGCVAGVVAGLVLLDVAGLVAGPVAEGDVGSVDGVAGVVAGPVVGCVAVAVVVVEGAVPVVGGLNV